MVKLWTCKDIKSSAKQGNKIGWKCEVEFDHAKLFSRATSRSVAEEEPDKPPVYALQFLDHRKVFTKMLKLHHCGFYNKEKSGDSTESKFSAPSDGGKDDKNPFLMTSSNEFMHLWKVESHPFDQQLKL